MSQLKPGKLNLNEGNQRHFGVFQFLLGALIGCVCLNTARASTEPPHENSLVGLYSSSKSFFANLRIIKWSGQDLLKANLQFTSSRGEVRSYLFEALLSKVGANAYRGKTDLVISFGSLKCPYPIQFELLSSVNKEGRLELNIRDYSPLQLPAPSEVRVCPELQWAWKIHPQPYVQQPIVMCKCDFIWARNIWHLNLYRFGERSGLYEFTEKLGQFKEENGKKCERAKAAEPKCSGPN